MAFVFETERSKLNSQKEKFQNLGPGQYLPLTEFKFQNPELVPFGVSTNRLFPEKPNPIPGPGSYYHDITQEKTEKILKNSVNNFITKEEEIKLNKIARYEPEKGRQEKVLKKYRENYELLGFSSKVKRFGIKKRMITPGPGAYTDNKNYNLAKLSEQKCIEKKDVIIKTNNDRNNLYEVDKDEVYFLNYNKNTVNNEKDKDNKKEKNKLKNKTKNNFNSKKEIKKRLEQERKNLKKEVKYRISSIPSKNNKGYIVEPDTGKLARKPNSQTFKIFSGDKDDAVGSGSYELIFPEDWKKTGTSWSKYRWEKDPKKIRPKSSYNVNSINCQIGNYRDNTKKKSKKKSNEEPAKITNSELASYYKSYTTKQLNYKDPTAHNIDIITEFIKKKKLPSFIPMNSNPGPGFYYDEENMSGLKKAISPPLVPKEPYNPDDEILNEIFNSNNHDKEKKIILDFKKEQAENFKKKMLDKLKQTNVPFLSKCERFDLEPYIRPRTSKTNKNKTHRKIKQNLMKGIKIRNNLNNNSNNLYPPGYIYQVTESGTVSHEVSNYSSTNNSSINNINNINIFYNRPQSMSGLFYRKDIRFRERVMEENSKKWVPGPGTYINPFTGTGKSNSIKMNGRYMDIRTCKKYMEKARPKTSSLNGNENDKNNYISHKEAPPIGYYEPEKIYTLKQNVLNKLKQGNRTFNSTLLSDRNAIYQFQKNAPNGPGTYFVEEKNALSQNNNAFNISSLRFEKGGKNNTKEAIEKISDNKIELNAVIGSVNDNREENKNEMIITQKGFAGRKYKNLKKRKSSDIGPGTYEYGLERYPWIKPSFNIKYI